MRMSSYRIKNKHISPQQKVCTFFEFMCIVHLGAYKICSLNKNNKFLYKQQIIHLIWWGRETDTCDTGKLVLILHITIYPQSNSTFVDKHFWIWLIIGLIKKIITSSLSPAFLQYYKQRLNQMYLPQNINLRCQQMHWEDPGTVYLLVSHIQFSRPREDLIPLYSTIPQKAWKIPITQSYLLSFHGVFKGLC